MNSDDLVGKLALAIANYIAVADNSSEHNAAREFFVSLRASGLAIVPLKADTNTCRLISQTIWKGMSQQEAEKVAPDIYREMVRNENLISHRGSKTRQEYTVFDSVFVS